MPDALPRLRPVLLLLALIGAMALGESGRARCGMHGLGAIATVPSESMSADVHSGGEHSSAAHHDAGGGRDTGTACDCSCIGDCSVPCGAAGVPTTPTLRVATVAAAPLRPFAAPPAQAAPREPDRLLPFANGPPLV